MTKKALQKMSTEMYFGKSIRHAFDVAIEYGNIKRIVIVQRGITKYVAVINNNGNMAIRNWTFMGSAERYNWEVVNPSEFTTVQVLWEKK